jgi:protoporphyrinogen oxidase
VHTRYPFQGSLYGLPPDVLKECLVGAIEARFGSLAAEATRARSPEAREALDCCADGSAPSGGPGQGACPQPAENFEQFIHRVWGAGVAKHFAIPYNEKLWKVPLSEMETSWLGGRVPLPNLVEMIEGALRPTPKPMGPNARFGYPLRGGFQALMDGFLPHLQGELVLEAEVVRVSPSARAVFLADGRSFGYAQLVSTLPLPRLVAAIGNEAPREIHEAAAALRHVSVRCVNLGIGRERITDKHWVYYPEDTVFHRIFMQGNASPHCNPPGGFGLTCEISHTRERPLPVEGDELVQRCIEDCIRVGVIRRDDEVRVANQVEMPYAYVVYDHARQRNVDLIRAWLLQRDIHLAGRYSEWEYYNSDHAFLAGRRAAATVKAALESRNALIA